MAEEIVRLENVWFSYDSLPVLEDINFSIRQDDFIGIIGPNGGGKSTLLKIVLGLVTPSSGSVTVFGESPQRGRREIGYVPQYNLYDRDFPISVWDAVLMGRSARTGMMKRYGSADKNATRDALEKVGMYTHSHRQVGRLSGGEQQRVFIARALVSAPRLLLLDEPTASVDVNMQAEFYELLEKLKNEMAIALVSHDVGTVSIYVDQIACMNRRLFYHGTKEISTEALETTYQCPIQMKGHGTFPHRVLKEHQKSA